MSTELYVIGDKVGIENDNIKNPGVSTNADKKPRSFDDVLVAMGPPSRYQFLQIIMVMTLNFPMVFVYLKYVFISRDSEFRCAAVNETDLLSNHLKTLDDHASYVALYNDSCGIDIFKNESGMWNSVKNIDCPHGYEFDEGKDVSFISEWELVCDKDGIPQLTQSAFAIGMFVGGLVINAFLSDKYGRLKTIIVSLVLTGAVEIASTYVPNVYTLIVFRFLSGVVSAGMFLSSYLLPFEMVVEKYRIAYSVVNGTFWSVHIVILAGIGYAFRQSGWRDFQLYSSIMGLYPLLFVYFINESTSWLFSIGRHERCKEIIQKACKLNRVNYDDVKSTFDNCCQRDKTKIAPESNDNQVKSYSALDLFKDKTVLPILLITWFVSLTHELTNGGLLLTASTLSGDRYVNMALLGIIGVPAYIASYVTMLYKGRRFVIIVFTAIAGICLLISTLVTNVDLDEKVADNLRLIFFILGKCAISGGYNTLFLYLPESFPTNLRASGIGLAQTGTNIGGILSPFLLPLSKMVSWAPGVIFASGCLLSAMLMTRLPETRGKKMTTALDD